MSDNIAGNKVRSAIDGKNEEKGRRHDVSFLMMSYLRSAVRVQKRSIIMTLSRDDLFLYVRVFPRRYRAASIRNSRPSVGR